MPVSQLRDHHAWSVKSSHRFPHGAARVIPVEAIAQLKIIEFNDGTAPGQLEEAVVAVGVDDGRSGAITIDRDLALIEVQLTQGPVVGAGLQQDNWRWSATAASCKAALPTGAHAGCAGTDPISRIGIGAVLDTVYGRVTGPHWQGKKKTQGQGWPPKDDVNHGSWSKAQNTNPWCRQEPLKTGNFNVA